jgi:hypothetical protein
VRDPLLLFLRNNERPIEQSKNEVLQALQFLSVFREPISHGYILLAGSPLIQPLPEETPPIVSDLILQPEILAALRAATKCGYEIRPDSRGIPTPLYQLTLDSGGCIGFELSGGKGPFHSPLIRIGEKLTPIAPEELVKRLKSDPFLQMDATFRREIHRTIFAVEQARNLHSALLFDRDLDQVIAEKVPAPPDAIRQAATAAVLDLTVPYLKGIRPERLMSLREEAPDAFLDFRIRLADLVQKAITGGAARMEDICLQVDREILPQIRELETSLAAATRKAKIQGLGTPLFAAVASLGGALLGWLPPEATFAAVTAGSSVTIKAVGDLASKEEQAKGHPFYFIWKARQPAR